MTEESKGRSGCFKGGCGCCGFLLLLMLGLLVIGGVGQMARSTSDQAVVPIDTSRELPADSQLQALATRPRESQTLALPLGSDPETAALVERGVGELRLDLTVGEFRIEPGPPGSEIRIEGDFESGGFVLEEGLEERDDGSWSYFVRFRPKRGALSLLTGAGNNPQNEITIIVPRGLPLDLVGDIGIGESDLELGGLFLRHVDLEFGTGDHTLRFSEPLQFAMEDFDVSGSVGSLRVVDLGNASPITGRVGHRIGETDVDLNGRWSGDADLSFDLGIGENRVRVPDDVHVDVARSRTGIGEQTVRPPEPVEGLSPDAPTLRLDLKAGIGEVRVTG